MKTLLLRPILFAGISCICLIIQSANAQTVPVNKSLIDSDAIPQVFAPSVISTPYSEWSISFSPDGKTVYSSQGDIYWTIIYAKQEDGKWMAPQVAPFSGRFRDTDPFVSPDGKKIFFISSRPFLKDAPPNVPQRATHIWYADNVGPDKWSEPKHLDTLVNLVGVSNYAPSVSKNGTLYYCSRRKGLKGMQSFYATWLGDHYSAPQQLIIKGAEEIQDPFIAPDESYLVFLDGDNLCISFKQKSQWTTAQQLGPVVNDGSSTSSPYVSRDGKMLYYTSNRTKGFYKRDLTKPAVNYNHLSQENGGLFNNKGNILMVPINLPAFR